MAKRKTAKELKEIIVKLKMDMVKATIPNGHCPYAYYHIDEDDADRNCDDCNQCKKDFFNKMRKIIEKEVAEL